MKKSHHGVINLQFRLKRSGVFCFLLPIPSEHDQIEIIQIIIIIFLKIVMIMMPAINIRKRLYDHIVRLGKDPTEFVNNIVEKELQILEKKQNEEGDPQRATGITRN